MNKKYMRKNEKKNVFVQFLGGVSKKISPFFKCSGLFTVRCAEYIKLHSVCSVVRLCRLFTLITI